MSTVQKYIVQKIVKYYAKVCLLCFGFLYVKESGAIHKNEPGFVVSNHCSWADIFYHLTRENMSFIAKDGVKNYYFVGKIASGCESIFVERNNP